jgi:hypothetical protein
MATHLPTPSGGSGAARRRFFFVSAARFGHSQPWARFEVAGEFNDACAQSGERERLDQQRLGLYCESGGAAITGDRQQPACAGSSRRLDLHVRLIGKG